MILGIGPAPLRAQSPAIASQPASRAVWTGANVTFAASASGAGPLSYQWQFNGKNLTNNIITTVAGGTSRRRRRANKGHVKRACQRCGGCCR